MEARDTWSWRPWTWTLGERLWMLLAFLWLVSLVGALMTLIE